jgi:hypothetical protein
MGGGLPARPAVTARRKHCGPLQDGAARMVLPDT